MSRHKGNNKRSKPRPTFGEKGREVLENIDENNRVIKMFMEYRNELDDKHDRYEKIVKLSRDITIETKRIIFLLHNFNTDLKEKKDSILEEANNRLKVVVETHFKEIGVILKNFDHYHYHKAYTSGLQEFIEALVFYQFLSSDKLEGWKCVNDKFQFEDGESFTLLCPQIDFLLGIADFTGEMMRRCINNLGVGNVEECFVICNVVKHIYTGFLGLMNHGNKELGRKIYVLKQSLNKMELVCYNIKIRGSEIPKHMLADVIESSEHADKDVDEGYY